MIIVFNKAHWSTEIVFKAFGKPFNITIAPPFSNLEGKTHIFFTTGIILGSTKTYYTLCLYLVGFLINIHLFKEVKVADICI